MPYILKHPPKLDPLRPAAPQQQRSNKKGKGRGRAPRKGQQLSFDLPTWGGKRQGAGRRPADPDNVISHRKRPALASRHPVHVSLDVVHGLPSLRRRIGLLRTALYESSKRDGFRLIHFSVQGNHIHLVVEAKDAQALARGIQALCIRVAKRLNKKLGRRGRVFSARYHAHILKTPTEVKNALAYVLLNFNKHYGQQTSVAPPGGIDPCSSGSYFDGWLQLGGRAPPGASASEESASEESASEESASDESPLPEARTWLLSKGWRRRGLVDWNEIPSVRRRVRGRK
jgi:REP element-mobilizing transposase RayT